MFKYLFKIAKLKALERLHTYHVKEEREWQSSWWEYEECDDEEGMEDCDKWINYHRKESVKLENQIKFYE